MGVECEVPPVFKKYPMERKYMPGDPAHLQFAGSFVVTLIVADAVPEGRDPVGWPLLITGGVVSVTAETVKFA